MLDKFIQIIQENNFQPDDIERVQAQPHPMVQFKFAQENRLRTPDDYGFKAPFLIACAAHRINPARWHDSDIKHDPKIQEFIQRVKFNVTTDEKDFGLAKLEDPRAYQMRIVVVAKGKTFKEKIPYVKGLWAPEEVRNTDEELVKKFTDNASRVLPLPKAEEVAQTLLELEKVENLAGVMERC